MRNAKPSTFGVIGLGRFGSALAMSLAEAGKDVIVVDCNEEKVRELRHYTEYAFVTDNLSKEALQEIGIQNCDTVIVCIGEKIDISILTTLNVVSLGVPHVIAKAISSDHGTVLEKIGAEVVYPERDMAIRLANRLETVRVLDFIQLSERLTISKLIVPEKLVGKTVVEADLRSRFGLNIIAIANGSKVMENVKPDYSFCKGDILFLSGSRDGLLNLSEWSEEQ